MAAFLDAGLTRWYMARDGYRCDRVVIDRVDVTMRCRGILFVGEKPVACDIYELDAAGQRFVLRVDGTVAHYEVRGEVTVERLRRA